MYSDNVQNSDQIFYKYTSGKKPYNTHPQSTKVTIREWHDTMEVVLVQGGYCDDRDRDLRERTNETLDLG